MTRSASFTKSEIDAAARAAAERGLTVTLEKPDGCKIVFSPPGGGEADAFDLVDMRR